METVEKEKGKLPFSYRDNITKLRVHFYEKISDYYKVQLGIGK